jgi:hypothetical protein
VHIKLSLQLSKKLICNLREWGNNMYVDIGYFVAINFGEKYDHLTATLSSLTSAVTEA